MVLWKPTRPSRTNWNAKVRSQKIPGVTSKLGVGVQNEAGQRLTVLSREHIGHSKQCLQTTQEKELHMDITRWTILKLDWLYSLQPKMEKLYTVTKTRRGADCGSDHELLIAKFRFQLKKVGKTTRSFRYNLNQIPYDYTVELTKRFKVLDLIDRVSEELRTKVGELYRRWWSKTFPRRRNAKKTKWLSEEALQIAEKREGKSKGEKDIPIWMQISEECKER